MSGDRQVRGRSVGEAGGATIRPEPQHDRERALPNRSRITVTTSGRQRHVQTTSRSDRKEVLSVPGRPRAAPGHADAAVGANAQSDASVRSPACAEPEPHLAGALRAAEAARAVAARVRATIGSGSAAIVALQGGARAAPARSIWQGLSVAEAAAAATIPFRTLSRPYGQLPYGAPNRNLRPRAPGATIHHLQRLEAEAESAPAAAAMPRCLARTIAELERLRPSASVQGEQPRSSSITTRI